MILENLRSKLKFPVAKGEIMEAVKGQGGLVDMIKSIPDRTYNSFEELKSEVDKAGMGGGS